MSTPHNVPKIFIVQHITHLYLCSTFCVDKQKFHIPYNTKEFCHQILMSHSPKNNINLTWYYLVLLCQSGTSLAPRKFWTDRHFLSWSHGVSRNHSQKLLLNRVTKKLCPCRMNIQEQIYAISIFQCNFHCIIMPFLCMQLWHVECAPKMLHVHA